MKEYYHNITQMKLNETDICDLIFNIEDGDIILKSEAGNALMEVVDLKEINHLKKMVAELNEEDED